MSYLPWETLKELQLELLGWTSFIPISTLKLWYQFIIGYETSYWISNNREVNQSQMYKIFVVRHTSLPTTPDLANLSRFSVLGVSRDVCKKWTNICLQTYRGIQAWAFCKCNQQLYVFKFIVRQLQSSMHLKKFVILEIKCNSLNGM